MTDAKSTCSGESLVQAMEGNFHDVWVAFARQGGRTVHIEHDVSWVKVDPAPWPSQVFAAQFGDGEAEERIEQIIAQMKAGQAPSRWIIGPSTRPADLPARLVRHGLVKVRESPGMAVELQRMNDRFVCPEGFSVSTVCDAQTLRQWVQVLVQGMFRGGQRDAEAFYALVEDFDLSGDSRFYIGRYRGEAVATSMLFPSRGVAGIYHVVTLPEYRSLGMGKRTTLAPLLEARERGYGVGVLHASQLGEVIYRQIGFRSYCTISAFALDDRDGR
jgi:GNAT superfamily N-acetyltransferase